MKLNLVMNLCRSMLIVESVLFINFHGASVYEKAFYGAFDYPLIVSLCILYIKIFLQSFPS